MIEELLVRDSLSRERLDEPQGILGRPLDILRRLLRQRLDVRNDPIHRLGDETTHFRGRGFEGVGHLSDE